MAISLDLFDRFLATKNNVCTGSSALLVSLTTLHISVKIHDGKKVKIATLANLSRGQFGIAHIEQMEWQILAALEWKLHPPTHYSFVYHLLQFLHLEPSTNPSLRRDVHELSRYLTELAVCDSYFIGVNNSTVAFAAILNVLDQISFSRISAGIRELFLKEIAQRLGLNHRDPSVETARDRLRAMMNVTGGTENQVPLACSQQHHQEQQKQQQQPQDNDIGSLSSSGSNSSLKESRYYDTASTARPRSNSSDSRSRRRFISSISPVTRGQRSSSPIVAGVQ